MQYYILRHEDPSGKIIDGTVQFVPKLPDYYQLGKKVMSAATEVSLVLDKVVKNLQSDFFLTTCGAFFVSSQMKEVLDKNTVELDYFSVDTSYFSGRTTEKKYFLIHVDSKVDCFDYLNSEYSGKSMVLGRLTSGELSADYKVRGIKKLCIEKKNIAKLDFLFVDNIIWIDPLVSENIIKEATRRGIRLNFEKAC